MIAVNIGNTNTAFSFDDDLPLRIPTKQYTSANELLDILTERLASANMVGSIIASVVPSKTEIVREALLKVCGKEPVIVDKSAPFGFHLSKYDCSLIGIDRLVVCYGALKKYTAPFAVFDMGTATSVSIVDKEKYFLGGAIMPGVQTMLKSLTSNTALLPAAAVDMSGPVIGRNTSECISAGVFHAAAGFVERYQRLVVSELGADTNIIVTGGNAGIVLNAGLTASIYESNLLLDGLKELYKGMEK